MTDKPPILSVENLAYQYADGEVLSFPDFTCMEGEEMLISGNSGHGKTTLIYLIAGLLKIQSGTILLADQSLGSFSLKQLDVFRGKHVGLVFQSAQFISALNVIENVIAGQYFGAHKVDAKKAQGLLESLGIGQLASKSPKYLSGGERQRLSIARAMASSPDILIADEPTSSLDDENAEVVYDLLHQEAHRSGTALIVVSHDHRLKVKFEKQIAL